MPRQHREGARSAGWRPSGSCRTSPSCWETPRMGCSTPQKTSQSMGKAQGGPEPSHLSSLSHTALLPQQVCTVENLNCFHTELQVIRWEHREHTKSLSLLIRNLSQMEQLKLKARTCKTDRPCHPCEGHQEQPVPQFLNKLLELLQRECWLQGSNVHSCSS
ncbi:uncharacterized protein LOC142823814 isoform X5 [Pelodiscus sinensis]|uniref:uncharacterized protein LOC142823814 isoform X5 n=1 Tax=Pelodiscus sinensis TaxID=13735 RepID=UPI003F6D56AF